ncbi:hypothetical protein EMQ25_11460 [Arsenicitalea aurantiaca]|uniref:Uncharacterized protein n=1 Tax=Arsenicitalea aurantiaca TaxID=1783274 RepID=A0A433X7C9_9HYPH|nr:hypothetical protein [Arsenicitalea aurantiaca]RUT29953.1 hypothetical protein EMQ25_11460 [Arsenicitalea aurantiaca]
MKRPVRPVRHPDRELECEEALEPALLELVAAAEGAGWDHGEIWLALVSLGVNHINADIEKEKRETNLRTARGVRRLFPDG